MEHLTPEILSAITGPFSALMLAVGMLFALGKLLAKWVPVMLEAHMQRFDRLIDSHDEDRQLYQNSIQKLSDRQDQMSLDIKVIRDAVTK
jgi:hypothetical protein